MGAPKKKTFWLNGPVCLLYIVGLYFFYIRYVPLIPSFQVVFLPILALTAFLTAANPRRGTLFFIFLFPLINGLPYFFGIYENTPHAPTALVLFLFFFLGRLIRRFFSPAEPISHHAVLKPMILFYGLVVVSAIITIFRFSNFYPFLADYVYELMTSVISVSAGGAIMSTVFYALNYLSEFAFFLVLLRFFKSRDNLRKGALALCFSAFFSLGFGLCQRFGDMSFGNTPFRAGIGTINATFKDPNSFGAFLAMMIPVTLGLFFWPKKKVKIAALVFLIMGIFLLPHTGSGSGLLGIAVSLLFFFVMAADHILKIKKSDPQIVRQLFVPALVIFLCFVLISSSLWLSKESNLVYKLSRKVIDLKKGSPWDNFLHRRWSVNWEGAVYMVKDFPLTGVGVGAYTIEISNYAELLKKSWPIGESAENYIFQIVSELGITGLILFVWIFWEVLRQMRRSYVLFPFPDRNKFLLIGALAGMVSFFINTLFHTYIGSYEIKYLFWAITAGVFCLPSFSAGGEGPGQAFSKRFKIASIAVFFLFGGIHLWNSTHALSLKSRTEIFHLKQNIGFYPAEKALDGREFRWTRSYGGIAVKVNKPVVEIPLHASHPDLEKNPVTVKVFLVQDFFKRKRLLGEIAIDSSAWKTYEFSLADALNQDVILLMKVSRTWKPLKTSGVHDPRELGIAVGTIQFKDTLSTKDP